MINHSRFRIQSFIMSVKWNTLVIKEKGYKWLALFKRRDWDHPFGGRGWVGLIRRYIGMEVGWLAASCWSRGCQLYHNLIITKTCCSTKLDRTSTRSQYWPNITTLSYNFIIIWWAEQNISRTNEQLSTETKKAHRQEAGKVSILQRIPDL